MDYKGKFEKGGAFALGNFDGIHSGHHVVIDAVVTQAQAMNVMPRVLTFEPHPRSVFQPEAAPFRLTPATIKERLLKECGVADVVALLFTPEFSRIPAQDFVEEILIKQLGAQHIVAGHDFVFGHNRGGDMQKLAAWLAPHKVAVTEIAPMTDRQSHAYSATRARNFLRQGEPEQAAEILGRNWSITGTVIKGAQRGRSIGVPTANIALGDYLRPMFGVYAVRAGRAGQAMTCRGVANIGVRPTVDGQTELLEAHLFDFDKDIYGQEWEFALTKFLRPEKKFENFDALKTQIEKDIQAAKDVL